MSSEINSRIYQGEPIGGMTQEELCNEILTWQAGYLNDQPIDNLRGLVVRYRSEDHHKWLLKQAGLTEEEQPSATGGQYL